MPAREAARDRCPTKKPAEAGANSMTTKNPPRRVRIHPKQKTRRGGFFAKLEAWFGIEPAYAALQAAA
jgi:hypothetical protein